MPKLCTYLIRLDTGLAPNPYHDWCTISVCTPNHQGAKLEAGDWIAGFLTKERNYRLVYLMEIEERIHLDDYFYDSRFQQKRPDLSGDWISRCGDNFYSQSDDGSWIQHPNLYHTSHDLLIKDTRKPYSFVGRHFWYFGENALPIPKRFLELAGGRGIRVNHSPNLVTDFIAWVTSNWTEGIHGTPSDRETQGCHGDTGIIGRYSTVDSSFCSRPVCGGY